MKRIIILPLFLLFFGCVSNDRVTELENRIDSLEVHVGELETKIANKEANQNYYQKKICKDKPRFGYSNCSHAFNYYKEK